MTNDITIRMNKHGQVVCPFCQHVCLVVEKSTVVVLENKYQHAVSLTFKNIYTPAVRFMER